MLLTAQKKLEFQPEDQPAMDRRLRSYTFKSLPKPRKKAAEWLCRHPMDCVMWASKQASTSSDRGESSNSSDESQVDDGILIEEQRDALRTLELVDDDCDAETGQDGDEMASLEEDGSQDDSEADQGIRNLRHALEQTCTGSLQHRHVSHLLQVRLKELERVRQAEENSYKQRQQALMPRGVTREHVALLPRDLSEPMPSQITNDLEVHRREALRDKIKRKMQRAVEALENPWLVQTEKELQECTLKLNGSSIHAGLTRSFARYTKELPPLSRYAELRVCPRWTQKMVRVTRPIEKRPVASCHQPFPVGEDASLSGLKKMATKQLPQVTEATQLHRRMFCTETAVARKFSSRLSRVRS